jgi:hypothetical protein
VKRKLQAMHTRRLRITDESSVGRESFTCVSRLLQFGQRMTTYPPVIASEAKQPRKLRAGLLRRFAPRNDENNERTCY